MINYENCRREAVILKLHGEPAVVLADVFRLIEQPQAWRFHGVPSADDFDYMLSEMIGWFKQYTFDEMDVNYISQLVTKYIITEMIKVVGHTEFETWYRRQGQALRIKMTLLAMHIKERLYEHNLYGRSGTGHDPEARLRFSFISTRGRDALLLVAIQPLDAAGVRGDRHRPLEHTVRGGTQKCGTEYGANR